MYCTHENTAAEHRNTFPIFCSLPSRPGRNSVRFVCRLEKRCSRCFDFSRQARSGNEGTRSEAKVSNMRPIEMSPWFWCFGASIWHEKTSQYIFLSFQEKGKMNLEEEYKECLLLRYKIQVRTSQETHYVSTTEPSHLMLCKVRGFHGGDYEEWRLLGYKNQVRTSQETHYFSATKPNQLMLYKIWAFHGGDYKECSLLGLNLWRMVSSGMLRRVALVRTDVSEEPRASFIGVTRIGELGTTLAATSNLYKNPVRTSQETNYFPTTDRSRLILCIIWGFHGSYIEECHLLGYKNPLRTSQETHYVSATELNRLMLCKIWAFRAITMKNVTQLLVAANFVPISRILVILMMEAVRSSETSVLTSSTLRNIPDYFIFHSNSRESLKSYRFNIIYNL
jgi:hypothetical protein